MIPRQQVIIQVWGRVQGVGFRAATRRQAQALGLSVSAENQSDGSVIFIATGPETGIEQLIAWASVGPPLAIVDRIHVTPDTSEPESE